MVSFHSREAEIKAIFSSEEPTYFRKNNYIVETRRNETRTKTPKIKKEKQRK